MSPAVIGDVEERSGRGCDHPDPQPARDREPAGAVRDEDIDEIEASVSCRAAVTADAPQSARDVVDVTCGHRDAVEGAGALRDDPDLCLPLITGPMTTLPFWSMQTAVGWTAACTAGPPLPESRPGAPLPAI